MIYFLHVEAFLLFFILGIFFYVMKKNKNSYESFFAKDVLEKIRVKQKGFSPKTRNYFLLLSLVFVIISLGRPVSDNGEVQIKENHLNMIVGVDISKSMFIEDIYPDRFEFAKQKFNILLKSLENVRISIIGFNNLAYLVSPFSEDYDSLDFLVKNIDTTNMHFSGTDFMSLLKATVNLYDYDKKKTLLIFTDGGEQNDFRKEIKYAKEHDIVIFVYAIGSDAGGVIKTKDMIEHDKDGNIIVLKINENIKKLAKQSGGSYMKFSLKKNDIVALSDKIKSKSIGDKGSVILDKTELFYYPLVVALLLFFMANFSFRHKSR